MRKASLILLLAAVAAAGLSAAASADRQRPPAQVFNSAAEPGTLQAKLDRALAEASKTGLGPFWIGYAIDRLQGERSHIGSFSDGDRDRGPTIADILAGRAAAASADSTAADVKRAATAALDRIDGRDKPEKKVIKELGFFLKYKPGKPAVLADVRMSNLELRLDFEAAPLYWLGKAAEDQSMELVAALYGRASGEKIREDLIAAAGCHGTAKLALPFLAKVLGGADPDELRKDAAFWISQLDDPEGLRLLAKTARADKSEEVREGAVFGISQIELPAAVDEMISLARGAERSDVRKQAVFWLSQMASEKSGKVLEEVAREDGALEVQEHAIFALAELPDKQGLDPLIKLAKTHPDARLRKKAIFWLGEIDDPRALEAIIAIVKGK
jgi:hypothetical protein